MIAPPSVRQKRRAEAKQAALVAAREWRAHSTDMVVIGRRRLPPIVLIGLAIMVVLLIIGTVAAVGAWMVDPLARGREALAAGNYRAARVDLMNAVAAKPGDVGIRIDLARAYNALGRAVEAERQLDKAIDLGARAEAIIIERAQAQLNRGDPALALATLSDRPIAQPDQERALRIAATAHYRIGDLAAAQDRFAQALRIGANDVDTWTAYARFRLAEQDVAEADRAADMARTLAPQSGAALAVKADVVRARAGPVAAIAWYEAALARDPDNVPVMLEYAASLGESGRYVRMLEPLSRAADLEPRNPRALFLQAAVAARGGEPALARTLLSRIAGGDADLPAVLQLQAAVALSLDTPVAAAGYAQRLVELQGDNRTARRLLALALAAQANPRGAIEAIDAITTAPDADSWSLMLLARSFGAVDWQVDSVQPIDRAARLERGHAAALRAPDAGGDSTDPSLAVPAIRAAISAGNHDRAIGLARALSKANPGVAQAWLLLGDASLASGDAQTAIRHFRRAAELRFDEGAMSRLVHALSRTGNSEAAGDVLAQYRMRWPENVMAMQLTGNFRAEAGDWAGAQAALAAAQARIGSNDALLLAQLARCELELGNVGAALTRAAHAYRLMPGNGTISGIYGIATARGGGSMTDAGDLLDKAVQLSPQDELLRQWQAEVRE